MSRLTFLVIVMILTFTGVIFASEVKSQNISEVKLSINVKQALLKDVLTDLKVKTGFNFVYTEQIGNIEGVNVSAKNESLYNVLKQIADKKHLIFNQSNYLIAVVKAPVPPQPPPPGSITGKVTDLKTGETLIGVTVQLVGGRGTQTDANGMFKIDNLPEGNYQISVSYVGYQKTKNFFVDVKAGQITTINFNLSADNTQLSQVTVVGSRSKATDAGTLDLRKNSNNVQDLVSAQQIQATASINTVQALQKVTGVSITDNKYVTVRGMSDRNVVVQLNGTRLSSANNDRSAVALDIIPAALMDYISVEKTLTPDKPADATAGLVEMHTKSFPDSLVIQINLQTGFNDQTGLGGNITSFTNAALGAFGQNAGNHRLPQDLTDLAAYFPGGGNLGNDRDINTKDPTSLYNSSNMAYFVASRNNQSDPDAAKKEAAYINKVQEELDPVITTSARHVTPNQNYSFSLGNHYKIGNKDLGIVFGLNYNRNTFVTQYGQLNQYSIYRGLGINNNDITPNPLTGPDLITPNNLFLTQRYSLLQSSSQEQLSYGGLGSISLRLNRHNDFSVNYLVNKGFESDAASENGFMPDNHNASVQEYQLRTTIKNLSNIQLEGNHTFGDTLGAVLNWKLSNSTSSQEDPDYRTIAVYEDTYFYNQYLPAYGANRVNLFNYIPNTLNGRFFRNLQENNHSAQLDFAIPFKIGKTKITNKIGGTYFKRERSYTETFLKLPDLTNDENRSLPNFDPILQQNGGDLNFLVSPSVIGITSPLNISTIPGQNLSNVPAGEAGWFYYPIKTLNNYRGAYSQNSAIYEMVTIDPKPWLRVVGGVRLEDTRMHVDIDTSGKRYAFDASGSLTNGAAVLGLDSLAAYHANLKTGFQLFPSGTAIIKLNDLMNLRLAYSKTIGRPELRELIPTAQFDPYQQALVLGNANLVNSYSQNADVRWEWFRKSGEVFAISGFYKRITHQIENTFQYSATADYSIPEISYRNNPEPGSVYGIELELRKDLGDFTPILKHITIGGNLMLAKSFTKVSPLDYYNVLAVNRGVSDERPLFDQPNYVLNCYLTYFNKQLGTTVNFYFNSTGMRLTQVSLDGSPNIYQLPISNLDFIINKRIFKRVTMNGYIKNLLNGPVRYAYTTQDSGGRFGTYNQFYYSRYYYNGREIALGFSYLF